MEGVRAIRAIKYKNHAAGKYARARAPLAWKYTNGIFESKDCTTSMKIVKQIERHNFCSNDLLTESNSTEIQTYKVEERTLWTPCKSRRASLSALTKSIYYLLKTLSKNLPFNLTIFTIIYNLITKTMSPRPDHEVWTFQVL